MNDNTLSEQYPLIFVERFKGRILFNAPMADYTSFGIGGPADVMAFPLDENDLREILSFAASKKFPFFIMGMGTNLLVRDGGYRGIVINMSEGLREVVWNEGNATAVVGAGVRTPAFVASCADKGLRGMEFAASIPGSMGGAAVMNSGAYGSDMSYVMDGVEVMSPRGTKKFIPADEMELGYRSSNISGDMVVTRVHVRLGRDEPAKVRERIKEFVERRKKTSASIAPANAGSIFRNPEGAPAGRLIEEAGFKGRSEGKAVVSKIHANYIVNNGGARASDVLSLMAIVRDGVYSRSGVLLEPEIKVVGEDG
ncbi:MAG: UDP-N-acetylmuramate dehydrogenase [Thermodesulfobacteriota bacterium]